MISWASTSGAGASADFGASSSAKYRCTFSATERANGHADSRITPKVSFNSTLRTRESPHAFEARRLTMGSLKVDLRRGTPKCSPANSFHHPFGIAQHGCGSLWEDIIDALQA